MDGTVKLGALCPDLKEQGWDDENGHLQKDADAISWLAVRGILTTAEATRARDRLVKRLKPLEHDDLCSVHDAGGCNCGVEAHHRQE